MSKKYLSALVCGFGAAVLTTIPGIQTVACCLLAPVASAVSIIIYKKSQPDLLKIKTGTGVFLGLLTAIIAAIFASGFEILVTYLTKTSELVVSMPQAEKLLKDMNLGPAAEESMVLLNKMIEDIQSKGFSFFYTLLITVTNVITYSIFGLLGGVIGTAIVNKRNNQSS